MLFEVCDGTAYIIEAIDTDWDRKSWDHRRTLGSLWGRRHFTEDLTYVWLEGDSSRGSPHVVF